MLFTATKYRFNLKVTVHCSRFVNHLTSGTGPAAPPRHDRAARGRDGDRGEGAVRQHAARGHAAPALLLQRRGRHALLARRRAARRLRHVRAAGRAGGQAQPH